MSEEENLPSFDCVFSDNDNTSQQDNLFDDYEMPIPYNSANFYGECETHVLGSDGATQSPTANSPIQNPSMNFPPTPLSPSQMGPPQQTAQTNIYATQSPTTNSLVPNASMNNHPAPPPQFLVPPQQTAQISIYDTKSPTTISLVPNASMDYHPAPPPQFLVPPQQTGQASFCARAAVSSQLAQPYQSMAANSPLQAVNNPCGALASGPPQAPTGYVYFMGQFLVDPSILPPPSVFSAHDAAPQQKKRGRRSSRPPKINSRPNYGKGPEVAKMMKEPGYHFDINTSEFYVRSGRKKLDYYKELGEAYNERFKVEISKNELPRYRRAENRNMNVCIYFFDCIFERILPWLVAKSVIQ